MRCPFCSDLDTKVIDSRLVGEGCQTRRRRECIACQERFTTYESAELSFPRIIKRDGKRELFSLDKLKAGVLLALQKRPVATDKIDNSIDKIIKKIKSLGEKEISSDDLGEFVMNELRVLDEIAYVRFASVYRRFKDIAEFRQEIDKLKEH